MKNRRSFLLSMVAVAVALAVVVGPALADELFGVITKVDIEKKTLTVLPKDADKEIEVTVTNETKVVTKKGAIPIDLEKLSKRVEGAKEKGAKGASVKIEHEKAVASKIEYVAKKKNAAPAAPAAPAGN